MKINLSIEHIVLDGFHSNSVNREQLYKSLQAEFTQLLSSGTYTNTLLNGGNLESLTLANINVVKRSPSNFGQQLAHAVHGGLTRE